MMCDYCHKTIHIGQEDYKVSGEGKTEKIYHIECLETLQKIHARNRKQAWEKKVQKPLWVWMD